MVNKMKRMKANKYTNQNVSGWFISEKLDGVFARWTGRELLSSNGNEYHAPKWFTDQLPINIMLEGELYIGRGMLGKIVGTVRKKTPIDSEWNLIKFHVFDAPEIESNFENRLAFASRMLAGCAIAKTVKIETCRSQLHLDQIFHDLVNDGAEGIMIHSNNSGYEYCQTGKLLKYKSVESDEAEVVGYKEGTGKYKGITEALLCSWKGVIFKLKGSNDEEYQLPYIGSLITFSFYGTTDNGIPRNASFLIERNYE